MLVHIYAPGLHLPQEQVPTLRSIGDPEPTCLGLPPISAQPGRLVTSPGLLRLLVLRTGGDLQRVLSASSVCSQQRRSSRGRAFAGAKVEWERKFTCLSERRFRPLVTPRVGGPKSR
jgi:hypothetical protein